jgi:hypothetical protein
MSDGRRVYACESEDEIIDLVKSGQAVFAIALDKIWTDLEGTVGKAPQRTRRPAMARAGGA